MATITPGDLFVPEVVGQIATEILYAKTPLLASGYVDDATNAGAFDAGGNTIKFPKFTADGALGVQALPDSASAVTPDEITMSYDSETVVSNIIAYQWTGAALEDALRSANVSGFIAQTVAKKSAAAIQTALLTEAATTSLTFTEDAFVTYKGLLKAKYTNWGEYASDAEPLAIMHSKVVYDLLCTEEAQKTGVYGATPTIESGMITRIAGLRVLALDSVATSGSGASTTYTNILLRPGALSLYTKRALDFSQQQIANSDGWNSWFTFRFATHLSADKPYGAITYTCGSTLDQA